MGIVPRERERERKRGWSREASNENRTRALAMARAGPHGSQSTCARPTFTLLTSLFVICSFCSWSSSDRSNICRKRCCMRSNKGLKPSIQQVRWGPAGHGSPVAPQASPCSWCPCSLASTRPGGETNARDLCLKIALFLLVGRLDKDR